MLRAQHQTLAPLCGRSPVQVPASLLWLHHTTNCQNAEFSTGNSIGHRHSLPHGLVLKETCSLKRIPKIHKNAKGFI